MKKGKLKQWLLCSHLIICFVLSHNLNAQLNTVFQEKFDEILRRGFSLSPGNHANHFLPAADAAANVLSPALNSFIARNISSFPLSATSAGVTFDFSTGTPVSITESLGPIFAETAKTLGKGKLNFGFNYTPLNPSRIRGLNTSDIHFAFLHEDVGAPGLGDSPNESDILDVNLNLDLDVSIFAFYFTAGITNNLDLGVAIPIINLSMGGEVFAEMNSFTWPLISEGANHFFGGDRLSPVLTKTEEISESASGIGDIAMRLKYRFLQSSALSMAMLVDARLPTGDETNFLGIGSTNVRFLGILSSQINDFTPHLNLGYDLRTADGDSDEIEFAIGFDQKIITGLTFAFDILGALSINDEDAISLFPGFATIESQKLSEDGSTVVGTSTRQIDLSNIPEVDDVSDNILDLSVGFRYAPSDRLQLLLNMLVPLNNGGLRATIAPTLGLAVSL